MKEDKAYEERWTLLHSTFLLLPHVERETARGEFYKHYSPNPGRDKVKSMELALLAAGIIVPFSDEPSDDITSDGAIEYEDILAAQDLMQGE